MQIAFLHFLDVRKIFAKHIFQPANHLHAAFFCSRNDFRQNVEIAVVRRARFFQHRVLVKLRMRRREISAVKIEIVFLFAVIGQAVVREFAVRRFRARK